MGQPNSLLSIDRMALRFLALAMIVSSTSAFLIRSPLPQKYSSSPVSSALGVTFFGGSESEITQDEDSCELVPVRIERTSANSRKIEGEITAPVPLMDVWAILTDYNRLSIHVPNLVESKITKTVSGGQMGDGRFRCRLYQKGAQKIIGFEFGASVTMDMTEEIVRVSQDQTGSSEKSNPGDERRIIFKCADSFFFQEFDGEWRAKEQIGSDGRPETVLSYSVDVRPKGPVPVAALEWRIREDVPTNLRAVKRAAIDVGFLGVEASRGGLMKKPFFAKSSASGPWEIGETMAAYLKD